MASAQMPQYSTPSTDSQASAMLRHSRIERFAGGAKAPRDISKYNRFVPSPVGPQTKAEMNIDNHLSATGQGYDPMSSIVADQVKLDGSKNSGKAPRKEDPNKYRKKGATVGKKARKINK